MSYHVAETCFVENANMVGEPMNDPQTYNLNNGLANLSDAINSDLSQIKTLLNQILIALQRR
jgi:hypothetical protein